MSAAESNSSLSTTQSAALKPVERVPHELLFEIFLLIVQEEVRPVSRATSHLPELQRSRYPWRLALVCTQWRKICLDNPRLWSYFHFSWHGCRFFTRDFASSPLAQVQLQLDRCPTPTPIFIYGGMYCNCKSQISLWIAVSPHSHRWAEVHLGYTDSEYRAFMELIQSNAGFHNLRHITFNCLESGPESNSIPFSPELNRSLSNVRSLALENVVKPQAAMDFPAWSQLTSLSLKPYHGLWTDLLKTLSQCTNLVNLDISMYKDYAGGMEVDEIEEEFEKSSVVLPHLASFALKHGGYAGKNALPFLQLPSLRCLGINGIDASSDDNEDYALLMALLDPSPPLLTELILVYYGDTAHLTKLLAQLPHLVALTFDEGCNELMQVLCQRPDFANTCPFLQQLRLNISYDSSRWSLDPALLLKMVASRVKAGTSPAPLKSIHIIHPRNASYPTTPEEFEKDLDDLRNTLEGGLKQFMSNGLELRFSSEEIDYTAFSTLSS